MKTLDNAPAFWADFAARHWERRPLAVGDILAVPPTSPEALFQTVVRSCDLSRGKTGVTLRYYVAGQPQEVPKVYHLLPKASDAGFAEYDGRVRDALGGAEYSLVVNNLEVHDFPLWSWSRSFLKGLYERVGMNKLGVYYALFIGNYSKTPFGVHQDEESVFHFPVVGTKSMRVWPEAYALKHPRLRMALEYEEFVKDSTLLKAAPGGLIYWPSGAWHIGEYVGEFTASLALSLNCYKELIRPWLANMVETLDAETDKSGVTVPFDPRDPQGGAAQLPDALRRVGEYLAAMSDESHLRTLWLKMVTGSNFIHVPAPAADAPPVGPGDTIQGSSEFPIVCLPAAPGRLLLSANGHVIAHADHASLRALAERIATGRELRAGQLADEFAGGELTAAALLGVLNQLQSIRAVWRIA